jgi:mono/diheme cytochrome c family protein
MNLTKFTIAAIAAAFTLSLAARAEDAKLPPASDKKDVTYATDIKPILDASCVKCHDSTKKPRAGIGLDTLEATLKGNKEGKIVIAGDSAKSSLVLTIAHVGDPDTYMPKGKGAKKLTDEQIGLVRAWIDQGAK